MSAPHPPRPAPLRALRIALWRELHARGPLYLAGPGAALLALPWPPLVREGLRLFLLGLVFPLLAVALGLRGGARHDRFFRSLGGAPGSAQLGRSLLALLSLLPAAAVCLYGLGAEGSPLSLLLPLEHPEPVVLLGLALLYASTALARTLWSPPAALIGPFAAGATLALGGGLSLRLARWQLGPGTVLRAAGLTALCLVAAPLLAARHSVWSADLRRGGPPPRLALLALLGLTLLGGGAAELLAPDTARPPAALLDSSDDGGRGLLLLSSQEPGLWGAGGGTWLRENERRQLLTRAPVSAGWLTDRQWLLRTADGLLWSDGAHEVHCPHPERLELAGFDQHGALAWHPGGFLRVGGDGCQARNIPESLRRDGPVAQARLHEGATWWLQQRRERGRDARGRRVLVGAGGQLLRDAEPIYRWESGSRWLLPSEGALYLAGGPQPLRIDGTELSAQPLAPFPSDWNHATVVRSLGQDVCRLSVPDAAGQVAWVCWHPTEGERAERIPFADTHADPWQLARALTR